MKNVFRNLSTLLNVIFKVGKMVTRSKFSADPLLVERNSPESHLLCWHFGKYLLQWRRLGKDLPKLCTAIIPNTIEYLCIYFCLNMWQPWWRQLFIPMPQDLAGLVTKAWPLKPWESTKSVLVAFAGKLSNSWKLFHC